MPACGSTLVFRSTSAIPTAPGSAARTRTPMGCCVSTFQRALISACTAPRTLPPWRSPSPAGPERPWAGEHRPRLWTSSSDQLIQAVLRRPLESTIDLPAPLALALILDAPSQRQGTSEHVGEFGPGCDLATDVPDGPA